MKKPRPDAGAASASCATGDQRTLLRVRAQPRASRNEIAGWKEDVLYVRLTAPPVEGAANRHLLDFLADRLGIRRSSVILKSGERSRDKSVEILGLDPDEARRRLEA